MAKNKLLLDSAYRRPTERRPVWLMRQAGRYLPEYHEVRRQYDFLTLCKTPDAAAEVSIQPYDILGVDAIIFFCDILIPCEAMGMELVFTDKQGPVFPQPLRSAQAVADLEVVKAREKTPFVAETISAIQKRIKGDVPVIGFAGTPWTLACYMVEGRGSRNFENIKIMMWNQPEQLHELLKKLTATLVDYIDLQLEGGADAFQLFDTWGGLLSPAQWREFSLPYIRQMLDHFAGRGKPRMLYVKGTSPLLETMAASGADVLSIDWMCDLAEARAVVGERTAIQGNLDPVLMLARPEIVEAETRKMLDNFGPGPGLICNLGHGLLPSTPVANVQRFVETVKQYGSR
ncbi:uroporphyrinogen decarboxylase [Planctomycetota bacterium]